jgi:hypothetical protein
LSKMKRFIMEVLPTDWSPSKTILHFTAGLFYIFFKFYKLSESYAPNIHIPHSPITHTQC